MNRVTGATLGEEEFAELLEDRTFVDYMNVFLSQPIFAQRILYRHSDAEFEFDPPLRRSEYKLDRRKLILWLMNKRIQLFLKSTLYREYILCRCLLDARLNAVSRDPNNVDHVSTFLHTILGHVTGMQRFRRYLVNSVGECVLNFWMDAEEFWMIDSEADRRKAFREIQGRYFHNGSALALPENEKWREFTAEAMSYDSLTSEQRTLSVMSIPCATPSGTLYGSWSPNEKSAFSNLQHLMLQLLKEYWLPKYIIHVNRLVKGSVKLADLNLENGSDEITRFARRLEDRHSGSLGHVRAHSVRMAAMFRHLRERVNEDEEEDEIDDDERNDSLIKVSGLSDFPIPEVESDSTNDYPESPSVVPSVVSGSSDVPEVVDSKLCPLSKAMIRNSEQVPVMASTSPVLSPRTVALKRIQAASMPKLKSPQTKPSAHNLTRSNVKIVEKQALPRVRSFRRRTRTRRFSLAALGADQPASENLAPDSLIDVQEAPESKVARWLRDREKKRKRRKASIILPPVFKKKTLEGAQLQALTSFIKRAEIPKPRMVKTIRKEEIQERTCDTYHSAVVWYRQQQKRLACGIAADSLSGQPFAEFLQQNKHRQAQVYLQFWNDLQTYMCSRENDINNTGEKIRSRLSRYLQLKYFHPLTTTRLHLAPDLRKRLVSLIEADAMDESLLHAQDMTCESLRRIWMHFLTSDISSFRTNVLVRTGMRRRNKSFTESMNDIFYEDLTVNMAGVRANVLHPVTEPDQDPTIGAVPERMWKALDLLQDVAGLSLYPPELMTYEEICEMGEEGSLYIAPVVPTTKFEYVRNILFPVKINIDKILVSKKDIYEPEKILRRQRMTDFTDSRPAYLRPIWRNGQLIERPSRPRCFGDILRDSVHVEFFKRFLVSKHKETPLSFWMSVEELKITPPGKPRQNKVAAIVKKYFGGADKGKHLNCDADVIREIPNMERVTQAMLISAQSCIAKSIEDKWGVEYMETFGHLDTEEEVVVDGVREWTKEKTKILWLEFVRVVAMFRRGILDSKRCQRFRMWLKHIYPYEPVEPRYDANKKQQNPQNQAAVSQAGSQPNTNSNPAQPPAPAPPPNPAPGMAGMKRIFRGKVVLVERLVQDLNFLIEVDRYRQLADNAARQAAEGSYSQNDEALMLTKATAIVTAYLDSDIFPRVQINVSSEIAEHIVDNFNNHFLDRGLFHDATHVIFPVLCLLWKRFCVYEAIGKVVPDEVEIRLRQMEQKNKFFPKAADYRDIKPGMAKHVLGYANSDDEPNVRFHFSLLNGLRQIICIPRPISEDQPGEGRSNRRGAVMHEPSTRRSAIITQKMSNLKNQVSSMSRRKSILASRNSLASKSKTSTHSVGEHHHTSRDIIDQKLAMITS